MPDNQMDMEQQEFGYTEEQYLTDVFKEKVDLAFKKYLNPERTIKIANDKLEDCIDEMWGETDDELKGFNRKWRENERTLELANGSHAYLLDTGDISIHNLEDTSFFYGVYACLAIIVDFVDEDNKPLRLTCHLKGSYDHKEMAVNALLGVIGGSEKIGNVLVMYNSKFYGKVDENKYIGEIENCKHKFVDMDEKDPKGSHDVIVRGNKSLIYHNDGVYENGSEKVWRVPGGEIDIE